MPLLLVSLSAMHARPSGRRGRRLTALALLLVLPFPMFRWFEHAQVYHPTSRWDASGEVLGLPWQAVEIATDDGVRLSAWYFPAPPDPDGSRRAVLFCHGNGGNVSHRLDYYRLLRQLNLTVLAFDYRGYGRSTGRPSEAGTYRDAEAALRWLGEQGFGPSNVVALGESLGGGIASHLAAHAPVAGLILHSTFTSIPDLGAELFPWLPVRTLARIRYDTLARLPTIHVPVLVLHSREDRLIDFRHAERNFAAAQAPKFLREVPGDHNDQPGCDPARFQALIGEFLRRPPPSPLEANRP